MSEHFTPPIREAHDVSRIDEALNNYNMGQVYSEKLSLKMMEKIMTYGSENRNEIYSNELMRCEKMQL